MWMMVIRVRRTIMCVHTSISPYLLTSIRSISCMSTAPRLSILVGSTAEASGKSSCYRAIPRSLSAVEVCHQPHKASRHLHLMLSTMSTSPAAFLTVHYRSTVFSPARVKAKSAGRGTRPDPLVASESPIIFNRAVLPRITIRAPDLCPRRLALTPT